MTALIPQVMVAEGAAWLTVPDGCGVPAVIDGTG